MMVEFRREKRPMVNDPFERINSAGRAIIRNMAAMFEGSVSGEVTPSEGERLALRRAMARFLIDSGIASANGYL